MAEAAAAGRSLAGKPGRLKWTDRIPVLAQDACAKKFFFQAPSAPAQKTIFFLFRGGHPRRSAMPRHPFNNKQSRHRHKTHKTVRHPCAKNVCYLNALQLAIVDV